MPHGANLLLGKLFLVKNKILSRLQLIWIQESDTHVGGLWSGLADEGQAGCVPLGGSASASSVLAGTRASCCKRPR